MPNTFATLIRETIGRHTGRPSAGIPVDVRFGDQDIGPETARRILADPTEQLDRDLPAALLSRYPTVEALAGVPDGAASAERFAG